jgi:hypothetical protein
MLEQVLEIARAPLADPPGIVAREEAAPLDPRHLLPPVEAPRLVRLGREEAHLPARVPQARDLATVVLGEGGPPLPRDGLGSLRDGRQEVSRDL